VAVAVLARARGSPEVRPPKERVAPGLRRVCRQAWVHGTSAGVLDSYGKGFQQKAVKDAKPSRGPAEDGGANRRLEHPALAGLKRLRFSLSHALRFLGFLLFVGVLFELNGSKHKPHGTAMRP